MAISTHLYWFSIDRLHNLPRLLSHSKSLIGNSLGMCCGLGIQQSSCHHVSITNGFHLLGCVIDIRGRSVSYKKSAKCEVFLRIHSSLFNMHYVLYNLYPQPYRQLTLQLRPLSKFAPSIMIQEGALTPINPFTRNKA